MHINLTTHHLHQPVADGQAQARAAIATGSLGIGLGKGVKQQLNLLLREANTCISHAHSQGLPTLR